MLTPDRQKKRIAGLDEASEGFKLFPELAGLLGDIPVMGTAFTMEQDFYKGRFRYRFGLDVLGPGGG
jgi:hypothetical protein